MGKRSAVSVEAINGQSEGQDGPFVMYFPSGYNPVAEENSGGIKICAYRKPSKNAKKQHIELIGATERVDFVGKNFGEGGEAGGLAQCVVGVFNEIEGTLKLLPLAGSQVFRMAPHVAGPSPSSAVPPQTPLHTLAPTREEQYELQRKLQSSFGRENITRKTQDRLKVRIHGDAVSNPQTLQAVLAESASAEFSNEDIYSAASLARNIPPHCAPAREPREAYPLPTIITAPEKAALKGVKHKLSKAKGNIQSIQALRDSGGVQELVLHYLAASEAPNKETLLCLAYLHALLVLKKSRMSLSDKDIKALGLPEELVDCLLAKFAETRPDAPGAQPAEVPQKGDEREKSVGFNRPHEKRDLLLCYILLMCLYANEFEVDIAHLALEFQLQPKELAVYFSELGCVVSRTSMGVGNKARHRATLLKANSKGKSLEELLPDRRPRPKAAKR